MRAIRTLPASFLGALDLVSSAARPELRQVLVLQATSAAGLAGQLLLGRHLLLLFVDDRAAAGLGPGALGLLAAFAAATALASFAAAALPEQTMLVAELVSRRATDRVIDVACVIEAEEFESPAFQDQLERVRSHGILQPTRLTFGLLSLLQALLGTIGISVALATVAAWLLPLALLTWLPIWLVARRNARAAWRHVLAGAPEERERAALLDVFLSRAAALEVRAFGLRDALRPRFEELLDRRMERIRDLARQRVRGALLTSSASAIAVAAGVGLLVALVARGTLGVAEAGMAALAVQQLEGRLRGARGATATLREALPFLDDLAALSARVSRPGTGAPPEAGVAGRKVDLAGDVALASGAGLDPARRPARIVLDAVGFTYPGSSTPALRDVSLTIEPGETLALVGRNGSGKSTLAKLLGGLYRPDRGRILRDGIDQAGVEPARIREGVSLLFQDFVRYPLAAGTNVGLGRSDRLGDGPSIRAAAELAGIGRRIERLPRAWDTVLSRSFEGGAELSVGEWQRLALARAFLRAAPVGILDEPTAAIDPHTEAELVEAILAHGRGRTLVLVSHRLSSARRADRIAVLDAGRLVEVGRHEELLARRGVYAELFQIQAAGYSGDTASGSPRPAASGDPGRSAASPASPAPAAASVASAGRASRPLRVASS